MWFVYAAGAASQTNVRQRLVYVYATQSGITLYLYSIVSYLSIYLLTLGAVVALM